MKKIQIIILVAAGILSFAGAFGVTFIIGKTREPEPIEAETLKQDLSQMDTEMELEPKFTTERKDIVVGMTEKQLRGLIYDIREKMKDYDSRERKIIQEEKQLEMTRQTIQEDIEAFNQLRAKLSSTLAALKQQEQSIKNTVLEITALETENLKRLAATYDKMDTTQASNIMISMVQNDQMNDVVKIIYYMNERNAGALLGEIGNTQADLASSLCIQLKRIKESG